MSIEQQEALIIKLGDLGADIPGLEVDPVIENIADKSEAIKSYYGIVTDEYEDNISRGMDIESAKEELAAKKKELIENFKANIKQQVNEQISIIKEEYEVLKEGLARVPSEVKIIISNIIIPPAISVPPSASNPIYALNLAKQSKNDLSGILRVLVPTFTAILIAANTILFVLPGPLLLLFDQLAAATKLVDSIPTPPI